MILGQPRLPFARPPQAGFYRPGRLPTGFFSQFDPFAQVMPRMASYPTRLPPGAPAYMNPAGPAPSLPAPPMAGPFGRASAYQVMRTGGWPRIAASGQMIRGGVTRAGQFIKGQTPAGFTAVNVPAGTYRR